METQLVQEPSDGPRGADPSEERAKFFMDLEIAELTAVVPRATHPTPKSVY